MRASATPPLLSGGVSSSKAVRRIELSTRVETVVGRVNRKAFPDGAYDDEFNDVDVDSLMRDGVDGVDGVGREEAFPRSLRHFNSDAAFALDVQTATAKKATVPSHTHISSS